MRYSGLRVIAEGLLGNRGWTPAWRDPEPSTPSVLRRHGPWLEVRGYEAQTIPTPWAGVNVDGLTGT